MIHSCNKCIYMTYFRGRQNLKSVRATEMSSYLQVKLHITSRLLSTTSLHLVLTFLRGGHAFFRGVQPHKSQPGLHNSFRPLSFQDWTIEMLFWLDFPHAQSNLYKWRTTGLYQAQESPVTPLFINIQSRHPTALHILRVLFIVQFIMFFPIELMIWIRCVS